MTTTSSGTSGERPGPYTWDDFLALEDDDRRELIDGELVEVEVPNVIHEHIVALLGYSLTAWARAGGGGHALASCYKVRISEKRGLMPDVQFFRRGSPHAGQHDALVHGHPDLVVEIISKTSRRYDRVKKLAWYAAIGVPEYWIVDPEARTFECLTLSGSGYVIAGSLADDEVFRPASFEALAIPLAELWSVGEA